MTTGETVIKDREPDLTEDGFVAELRRVGSPVPEGAARGVYRACVERGLLPSAIIGIFREESSCGTNPAAICVGGGGAAEATYSWGNTTEDGGKPSFGGTGRTVRGRFSVYRDWYEGGVSTVRRLCEYAPYLPLRTVREIITLWAPKRENRTEAYIAGVEATIARLGKGASVGHVPKPPINVRLITNKPNGVGVTLAATPRKPLASSVHSMIGTLWGCDAWFRKLTVRALTDFGIGLKDTGDGYAEILQWCDPFGKIDPWANGEATGVEGDGTRFIQRYGIGQVNHGIVSIELDDNGTPQDSQGRPTTPVSAAQWSSLCWLLAYVHAEWLGQTAATFDWNLHHREFATKDCPFPRVYDHTEAYQVAVKAIMDHWQAGIPYPQGGVIVAGKRLAVPTDTGTVSKEPIGTGSPSASPHARIIAEMGSRLTVPQLGTVQGQGYVRVGEAEYPLVEFEKGRFVLIGDAVESMFVDDRNPYSFAALDAVGKVRWG